ncbi:MAG TPA: secondary thiamine-phosphate synthase enzyme YjbQ [bacterium]|nr:secondary thiamine-phosphate synthase enzyme YjbQ [bacterium]
MDIKTLKTAIKTKGCGDIVDITNIVAEKLANTEFNEGNILIFAPGATTALTTIEYEDGLIRDLKDLMKKLAPADFDYFHNRRWNDGNGHSHLLSALFKASLTIPFYNKTMILGTWQQIVFVECDNRPRTREIIIQITGK